MHAHFSSSSMMRNGRLRYRHHRHRPLVVMDFRLQKDGDGVDAAMENRLRFGIASLFASANIDAELVQRARHPYRLAAQEPR